MNIDKAEIIKQLTTGIEETAELIVAAANGAEDHGRAASVTVGYKIAPNKAGTMLILKEQKKAKQPTSARKDTTWKGDTEELIGWEIGESHGQTKLELGKK